MLTIVLFLKPMFEASHVDKFRRYWDQKNWASEESIINKYLGALNTIRIWTHCSITFEVKGPFEIDFHQEALGLLPHNRFLQPNAEGFVVVRRRLLFLPLGITHKVHPSTCLATMSWTIPLLHIPWATRITKSFVMGNKLLTDFLHGVLCTNSPFTWHEKHLDRFLYSCVACPSHSLASIKTLNVAALPRYGAQSTGVFLDWSSASASAPNTTNC